MTPLCAQRAVDLYRHFVEGECIVTDCRTAEMAKLTENSFRDVNIAFANELSLICDKMGIDVWELIRLANRHPRVNILQPGPGVGGHCIAVDPWFIVSSAPAQARLVRQAREVNDSKPRWVLDKIDAAIADWKKIIPTVCRRLRVSGWPSNPTSMISAKARHWILRASLRRRVGCVSCWWSLISKHCRPGLAMHNWLQRMKRLKRQMFACCLWIMRRLETEESRTLRVRVSSIRAAFGVSFPVSAHRGFETGLSSLPEQKR